MNTSHSVVPTLAIGFRPVSCAISRWLALCVSRGCLFFFALFAGDLVQAQDQITLKDERTGKVSEFNAMVLDWDAKRLVYSGNGRESTVGASRVIRVQYARSRSQLDADSLYQEGKFLEAMSAYDPAIQAEQRNWVKIEMRAQQLRCAKALGMQPEAVQYYLEIGQLTTESRYFHLIPVTWLNIPVDGNLTAIFERWLGGQDPEKALLACSWLLQRDHQSTSERLRELSGSANRPVAQLANAQLWRSRFIEANATDIDRWQVAIDRMPESLQAGPRFVVAITNSRLVRAGEGPESLDLAVVQLMQVPILFPEHYQIAGAALAEVWQMLKSAGREDEAAIVLAELNRDFGLSAAAITLSTRVQNLDQ